jgi:hypothetical protein
MAGESYSHAVGSRCAADPAPGAQRSNAARVTSPPRGTEPWSGPRTPSLGTPQ